MDLQLSGAELACMIRAWHPSSVTASDLLQMPMSEQQEIDLIWRHAWPRPRLPWSRCSVMSLAATRSTLATTVP